MNDPDALDSLVTPGWMHMVADSGMTTRTLAKAQMNGERLHEARASADPRSAAFVNGCGT